MEEGSRSQTAQSDGGTVKRVVAESLDSSFSVSLKEASAWSVTRAVDAVSILSLACPSSAGKESRNPGRKHRV